VKSNCKSIAKITKTLSKFYFSVENFSRNIICYTSRMDRKKLIWFGMIVGSAIGGYIPLIWGDSFFSFTSVILTAVGGIAGIWLGFKLGS
jgi:hypothetical protein